MKRHKTAKATKQQQKLQQLKDSTTTKDTMQLEELRGSSKNTNNKKYNATVRRWCNNKSYDTRRHRETTPQLNKKVTMQQKAIM